MFFFVDMIKYLKVIKSGIVQIFYQKSYRRFSSTRVLRQAGDPAMAGQNWSFPTYAGQVVLLFKPACLQVGLVLVDSFVLPPYRAG
jgi:hypothetical protein